MDFSAMFNSMLTTLGNSLPKMAAAILILIFGWFVAVAIRAGVRKLLSWLKLNERVSRGTDKKIDLEGGIARGIYYLLVVLVFIAFFDRLDLELVASPLRALADQIFAYAPKLIAGVILLITAWALATFLRAAVTRLLSRTKIDDRLSQEAGMRPMSDSIGQVLYWLVFLIFLPAVLGALELNGLLKPVEGMIDKLLSFVPNIFAAVVIALVGWFVGRIVRDLVRNLLVAAGADPLGVRAGLKAPMTLSRLVGLVVYVVILIPVLVAALDALKIATVSEPATRMLGVLMSAIPGIFAAALILGLSYFVLRLVSDIVTKILGGTAFNTLPVKLGLGESILRKPTASEVVGRLMIFFGMLFATVEAANRLGFEQVTTLLSALIHFGGQILLGLVVFGIGLWIARLVHAAIVSAGGVNARTWAALARIAILGTVIAMGLRAMNIADNIVYLAFGLTLGAVAVAVALSFGLGGREAAGRQMEHWLGKLRGE